MIKKWEIMDRQTEKDYGFFAIENKQVRSPRTGKAMVVRSIRFAPWAMVLAITPENEAVMVRQYRHGTEKVYLELPGGLIDPEDASPESAGHRELLEETGYRVPRIAKLGECFPQPAVLTNQGFFFVGTGAEKIGGQSMDEGEDIEVVRVPMGEIPGMIENREITHGMVILAFAFYWMRKKELRMT